MAGAEREIEWLAAAESEPAAATTTVVERSTSRRGVVYGAGILLLLAVVALVLTRSDDAEVAAPTTTTTPSPTTTASPRPTARIVGDGTEVPAGAVRDLTALAGLGLPLEMVVTSPTSDEAGSNIAWTEHGSAELTSFVLDGTADTDRIELPATGILQGWGHWGYALQSSGAIFSTTIVSPDAELVTLDHPGRFAAFLPDRGALVSGGLAAPTVIDTETGESSPMPGVASNDFVWSVAAFDDTEHLLVVPGLRGAPGPGTVLTLEGPVVTEVAMTPTVTDLVLIPDGDGLVLVNQEPADGLAGTIAIVSRGGGRREIRVPDLFPGREWVLTMTGHAAVTG